LRREKSEKDVDDKKKSERCVEYGFSARICSCDFVEVHYKNQEECTFLKKIKKI
jgi:hypothetical protein